MIFIRKYHSIFSSILIVLFLGIPFIGISQQRIDTLLWQERFTMFLKEGAADSFLSDKTFPGSFSFNTSQNPVEDYKKINSSFFSTPSPKLEAFYLFLEELNSDEKKELIRTFSFFEAAIQAILAEKELPVEIKYLPPALSAMNFWAGGNMQRAGIWQLTHFQGILNGAKIDKLVDERFHPLKSTHFATRQLNHDFQYYNDYNISVAALICGNAEVKNAIVDAGQNAQWSHVREFLPEYFQETIAAFQAMTVFLSNNIFTAEEELVSGKPEAVKLNYQVHFKQIEEFIGIAFSELRFLNPQFKHFIIPANGKNGELVVPALLKNELLVMRDSVMGKIDSSLFQIVEQQIEYPPEPTRSFIGRAAKDIEIDGKTRLEYMLQTGDVLGIIAEKFDVSVSDLKYWNNIYNERRIQAGQKISVFVPDEKVDYYSGLTGYSIRNEDESNRIIGADIDINSRRKVEHIVKNGESPFVIAQKYEGVTPEAILQWNHIDNARKIQIGQKLIIYIPK